MDVVLDSSARMAPYRILYQTPDSLVYWIIAHGTYPSVHTFFFGCVPPPLHAPSPSRSRAHDVVTSWRLPCVQPNAKHYIMLQQLYGTGLKEQLAAESCFSEGVHVSKFGPKSGGAPHGRTTASSARAQCDLLDSVCDVIKELLFADSDDVRQRA